MSSLRWTHQTTAKIAGQLDRLGIRVGARTVARLLDKLPFPLRVHCKKIAAGNRSTRDQQSATLPGCAVDFCRHRNPIVSVDAKKRELLGNFKNAGRKWQRIPTPLTAVLCSSASVTRPPPLPSLLPLVAPGGMPALPQRQTLADPGRHRRQQFRHALVVGRTNSSSASVIAWGSPSPWPTIPPAPPSTTRLTPPVQSNQRELGRRASHRLRQDPRSDPQNHHHHGTQSARLPGHEGLPAQSQTVCPKVTGTSNHPAHNPAKVEVHHA